MMAKIRISERNAKEKFFSFHFRAKVFSMKSKKPRFAKKQPKDV